MIDNIKKAFTYSKGERIAIIILAAVILILIAANFFIIKHKPNVNFPLHNLDSILSLHENALQEIKEKELNEHLERKKNYPPKTEKKKQQKLPKAEKPKFNNKDINIDNQSIEKIIPIIDINKADTLLLLELPEIGPFFARNIVEYRTKLGGFIEKEQLLDVYGFDSLRLAIISPYIVIDSIITHKIRINYDDFKTILKHPYIEYEDVKKIVNYRDSKGMITDWKSFLKVVEREDIDKRLEKYLKFDN